jgi:hypothetical protein
MKQKVLWGIVLLAWLCVGAAALVWWLQKDTPAPPSAPTAPVAMAPAVTPPAASATPAAPAIRHPIEAGDAASAAPASPRPLPAPDQANSYVAEALTELLGRKPVLTFLSTDNFVARLVATVDNLDRPHASPRLWPVNPTAPKFLTVSTAEGATIGAENPKRYAPFVQFVASVNTARAVALYKQLYPLFQRAYEELGYPGKYFNDRMVQVIDHLLETPEPAGPMKVRLTEVKGPIESATPWVRYEYVDAALESRSAGQKLLLRTGPDNARQLKAKLAEARRLVARDAPPR